MQKRILALVLAALMLLGCTVMTSAAESYTISNADELKLLSAHPDASFEIVCDIDLSGKTWTPVGTEAKPFSGIINGNGYEITNLKIRDGAVMGFLGYNAGTIKDLNIFEYKMDSTKASLFGSLAAVNNGTISNCTTSLGFGTITAPSGARIGQIAAVNHGSIEDTVCAIDLTVNAKSDCEVGGLVAFNNGTIKNSEAAGRMILDGKMTAGLIAADVSKSSLCEASCYTGTMAKLNGELMKTMLPTTNLSSNLKDCLWRDNTSSLELLDEEAQQTRLRVLDYSNDLATLVWYVPKDIDFREGDADSNGGGHDKYYKQGEIWYGLEYSHRGKNLGTFSYCIGEDDVLKDFLGDGPDGIDMYMSNDCSGTMISCVQTVSPSLHASNTRNIMPGYYMNNYGPNGFLPVGYVVTEKARTSGKMHDLYTANSLETMKEAWAQALPGDGGDSSTEGHARLFVASKIMRDKDNIIDADATIIYMNGMGDGITRAIYHTDIEHYGPYTLQELLDDEWVPVTTKELQEGRAPKAEVSLTDEGANDRAHICQGIVHSNYALWGCRMKIFDQSGKEVWSHMLWEKIYKYGNDSNYRGRHSYYEFDLSRFSTSFATADLTEGKTYTVKVTTVLADRGEYPVREYTFKY